MAYVRNPNFDPTDRNSRRFIDVPDTVAASAPLAVATQQEVQGNRLNVEQPTPQPVTPTATPTKVEDTTKQPAQIFDPKEVASLAGKAGLSVDALTSLLKQGSAVTGAERTKLEESMGVPGLIDQVFNTPSVKTQDLFTQLYNGVGLQGIKQRIQESNDAIAKEKDRFLKAKETHQNNPWLSQATRNAKIARERDLSNGRLQALVDAKQADVDLFNQGLEQVESEVSRASKDNELDRSLNAQKLEFLLRRVDEKATATEADRTNENLRYVPDFLKSSIAAEQAKSASKSALGASFFGDGGVGLASPRAIQTVPTFDEWIAEKQKGGGTKTITVGGKQIEVPVGMQTFSQATRDKMRPEYDAEIARIKAQNSMAQEARTIARLSPEARSVVKNPSLFFDSFTPTQKSAILKELETAGVDTTQIARGRKKSVSSTTADDLSQARLAKQNMVEIGQLIEELGAMGPAIGRIRQQNPYDDRVVQFNRLITQAVPGLARGIFKEVGVLTDTDVARYTSTIANPNLTKDQAVQATEDILRKIDQSINLQVETLDALGYEVGNFSDLIGGTAASKAEQSMSDDQAYAAYLKLSGNK